MDFIESVKEKAKNNKKTIILPEGMDKRTYKAAEQILKEGFADLIILATPEEVEENSDGAWNSQNCRHYGCKKKFRADSVVPHYCIDRL